MDKIIKYLEHSKPLCLKDQIEYEPGKAVSLSLAQKSGVGMTLLALDEGAALSTHAAPGDAMANILEGKAEIVIDGEVNEVNAGEIIIMPATVPHSVKALTKFKMLLTVVKP